MFGRNTKNESEFDLCVVVPVRSISMADVSIVLTLAIIDMLLRAAIIAILI